MRRLGWLGLISALAMSVPPQAQAQAKVDPGDLECLAIAFMMVGNKDDSIKQIGLMTSLYYLGKIDSKNPTTDLEQPIYDELTKITPVTAEAIGKRCGAELQARGKSLTDVGQRIENRTAAAAAQKAQ